MIAIQTDVGVMDNVDDQEWLQNLKKKLASKIAFTFALLQPIVYPSAWDRWKFRGKCNSESSTSNKLKSMVSSSLRAYFINLNIRIQTNWY